MTTGENIKLLVKTMRPNFLLLSLILTFFGATLSLHDGFLKLNKLFLAGTGLILLHISVNTMNEYQDYLTGIDLKTRRTPFSGGSGALVTGKLNPKLVQGVSIISFLLTLPIAVFFLLTTGPRLVPIILLGAVAVLLYSSHLSKLGLGELFAGLGLGSLPVLGVYVTQTGFYTPPVVVASIPPGILTFNLLLLNEIPDIEADKTGGRRHIPIVLGAEKTAKIYTLLTATVFILITIPAIVGVTPKTTLIGLTAIPIAIKASIEASSNKDRLLPAMRCNTLLALVTPTLLGIGYLVHTT